MAHAGAEAHGGFRREILCHNAARKAHNAQQHQHAAAAQYVAGVAGGNAYIDDLGHHQRDKQVKQRLQHLECRGDNAFLFIVGQIDQQLFQRKDLHSGERILIVYHKIPTGENEIDFTNWGLAKKGKVICYDVGRVLAPAADGRSYCNRTACRQDAGVIGTHLRTSACLLR